MDKMKNIRSFQHLLKNAENDKIKTLIFEKRGVFNICKILKMANNNDIIIFNNLFGKRLSKSEFDVKFLDLAKEFSYQAILNDKLFTDLGDVWFLLSDDFNESYENFLKQNRKLTETVIGNYCKQNDSLPILMYHLSNASPNIFVWSLLNLYKYNVGLYYIIHCLNWNNNYNNLSSKLKKHSITAYNGLGQIKQLIDETIQLRREKRAKDVISSFNTKQKKILKEKELNEELLILLNKFYRLTYVKQKNFITKMSSVETFDDIILQMKILCGSHFNWSEESLKMFINGQNLNCKEIYNKDKIIIYQVFDYEAIKYLAKSTNWCISKNKKYWNTYVELNKCLKQYVYFNFNLKEDDENSIIGFTINQDVGIVNAHSISNKNIVKDNTSYNSILSPEVDNIENILLTNNVDISNLFSIKNKHYTWNKDSFMDFFTKNFDESDNTIILDNDNKVVLLCHSNPKFLINEDVFDYKQIYHFNPKYYILFFDFNKPENDNNRLLFSLIGERSYSEYCIKSFSANGIAINKSIYNILKEFGLSYNIIKDKHNLLSEVKAALDSMDLDEFKNIILNNQLKKIDNKIKYEIYNSLSIALYEYKSSDLLDIIYNEKLSLFDVIGNINLESIIYTLLENLNYYYSKFNKLPSKNDFNKVLEYKSLKERNLTLYTWTIIQVNKIISNEPKLFLSKNILINFSGLNPDLIIYFLENNISTFSSDVLNALINYFNNIDRKDIVEFIKSKYSVVYSC